MRLALSLTHGNMLGVDGGAYLLSVNDVLGDEPTSAGFPRPPLAPGWLLVPFVQFLGNDAGYKVWSSLAAIGPLLPVYLLSRRILTPWQALLPVLFISVDMLHAEMFVTGALPLIGFTFIGLAVWAAIRLTEIEYFHWPLWLLLILTAPLTSFINQTSAGLYPIVVGVAILALMAQGRFRLVMWRVAPAIVLGTMLAVRALPWYLDVLPGSAILHYPGPWIYLTPWPDAVWFQFALAMPLSYWLIRYGQGPVRLLGTLTAVLGVLLVFLSTDETVINLFYRSGYLLQVFLYPGLAWVVFTYWRPVLNQRVAWAAVAVVVSVASWEYVNSFYGQAEYSDMVTVETAEALEYLRDAAPGQGVVTNAFTLSLWVSGLNKVETPHVWTWEPPRAFTGKDAQVRCIIGWVDGCDNVGATRALRVSYVLVDRRFPYYNDRAPGNWGAPPNQWEVTASAPWLDLVYSEGTTRLWKISNETAQSIRK